MIGIIDYGAGNLGSVQKTFAYLDVPHRVITSADEIGGMNGIVLPGVGAFGAAAEKLRNSGFASALKEYIAADRPFLGICLGMQLLLDSSRETDGVPGLGIVKGTCLRFRQGKVPQIGWNRVNFRGKTKLFAGIPDGAYFYFLHSYYLQEEEAGLCAAVTDYHKPFTSVITRGNLWGVQFHPEKSGEAGLQVIKNWLEITKKLLRHDTAESGVVHESRVSPCPGTAKRQNVPLRSGMTVRIIPCLDVDKGRVKKGVKFKDIRDAGDPVELANFYNNQGADEITFLDIGATYQSRRILLDVVEKVSRQVFVPLSVGGGISSIEDMRRVLNAGADKVSLCSAALRDPSLLTQGAKLFGSQCIVLSIDAQRAGSSWHAFVNGGRIDSGIDALQWAEQGEKLGAGEILLNSIDRDGTKAGYDLELTRKVSQRVNIPVIASGGAGNMDHMVEAAKRGNADAILLASLLHDRELGVGEIKSYLKEKGVNVRW